MLKASESCLVRRIGDIHHIMDMDTLQNMQLCNLSMNVETLRDLSKVLLILDWLISYSTLSVSLCHSFSWIWFLSLISLKWMDDQAQRSLLFLNSQWIFCSGLHGILSNAFLYVLFRQTQVQVHIRWIKAQEAGK